MKSTAKPIAATLVLVLGLLRAAPFAASDPLESIVEPYLTIHAALAADKTAGVATEASRIAERATAIERGTAIAAAAKKLAAATDLKSARGAFAELSAAMIERVEGKPEGDLKVAYCPMAGRSWLQKGKEILNPYYGSLMAGCGEFKSKTSP